MCAFESALNSDEIGSKKSPLVAFGLRPNVTPTLANLFFSLLLVINVRDFQSIPHNSRILTITYYIGLISYFLELYYVIENVRNRGIARKVEIPRILQTVVFESNWIGFSNLI